MNILIIGGTKFMGPYVIEELIELGHNIAVFNRGISNVNITDRVKFIKGDRQFIETYIDQFKDFQPDVVLDMIPYHEKEAEITTKLFEGIARRVVAISSADVYQAYGRLIGNELGEIIPTPSTEQSKVREKLYPYRDRVTSDHLFYDYDKILVERVYMSNPNLPATILRLPMVYGPGDKQHRLFPYLKRIDDGRPAILLDEKFSKWKTARGYVENVAHAIVLAITSEASSSIIYNVVENNFEEYEWVEKIKKYTQWKGTIQMVPSGKLKLDLNPEQNIDMSSDKIRKELGYEEKISFEEGLARTIEWENLHPPENVSMEQFNYKEEDKILEEL